MKINLVSDLHLDIDDSLDGLDGGDVLLIAGDTCESHHIERFQDFFEDVSEKFGKVYVIAGNHEPYGSVMYMSDLKLDSFFKQFKNVTFQTETSITKRQMLPLITIGDKMLFMATFWTDFNHGEPLAMLAAQRWMNDYRHIKTGIDYSIQLLRPEYTFHFHNKALTDLKLALAAYPDTKFIVMTHHAPSFQSVHPKYHNDILNAAYASDLDDFILEHPQIEVWCHGHTHTSFAYRIGDCRILCNPRGYGSENAEFNKNFSFEVE